nr:adenylate/guanylate cyclase domain-containing protein [Rhodospirillaceae bacterium]
WIQLTLVMTFGILYILAPKTSAPDTFQSVPWALGLYFLFTVVRLAAAYRGAVSPWLLMISIIMDMGLLMVLIWSFHIQYEQPASFYLKAPTMLYVFIFIALRALRFDSRYVLMAGAAALVGWLILVFYVLYSDPQDPMITRNYVEYLTSNSILIGAEVDKLLSIALVTLVLALAIYRGERMMRQAAITQNAAQDLSRFVPQEIADHITQAEHSIQAGDGESKVASVLFTDIEGFSTVSEKMTPQELVATLNDYFGAVYDAVHARGGVIGQYQGDAMLITFNTVSPDDNHAVSAVQAAMDIRTLTQERTFGNGVFLKTRCGVNTGEMTVGAVGAAQQLIFTVHGDEVNVAARLEQLNKEYGTYILISRSTWDQVKDVFPCDRAGEVIVRGRSAPTEVYTVRG